jgi:hypothetical protein
VAISASWPFKRSAGAKGHCLSKRRIKSNGADWCGSLGLAYPEEFCRVHHPIHG